MKRGKRQVADRSNQEQSQQKYIQPQTQIYFNNQKDTQPLVQKKNITQTRKQFNQPVLLTNSLNINQNRNEEMDQKKRKIQLLKQKYLKKSKPDENKVQSNQSIKTQSNNVQPIKRLQNKNINGLNKQQQNKFISQAQQPHKKVQVKPIVQVKQIIPIVQDKIKQNINVPEVQNSLRTSPVSSPNAPSKQKLKIPPPPVKKVQQKKVEYIQTQTAIDLQQYAGYSLQNSKPIQSKSMKQQTKQTSPSNQKIHKQIVPPPPNKNMKQIMNKRLNKQIPKPKLIMPQINNFNFESQQPYVQPVVTSTKLPIKNKSIDIDDQYNQLDSKVQITVKRKPLLVQSQAEVNIVHCFGEWLTAPQLTLKQLYPQNSQTIHLFCLSKHTPLQLHSSNPTFTQLTRQFIQSFIINNTIKLTNDQQSVTQAICLNYFYTNANQMNDTFLVALLKMGSHYCNKYVKALQDKLEHYLLKIIQTTNLFLNEQIDQFISFSIQKHLINQNNVYLYFMIAHQNKQLINYICTMDIRNIKCSLALLCVCKLNLKSKSNKISLYIHLLSAMIPNFSKYGLLQKILTHLKQLQTPQSLYQALKQLKLKLLRNYDQKQSHLPQQTIESKPQTNKQSGLFGYFNLNKAIDKIKTSTTNVLNVVQKTTKPQPVEQEKKEVITYDPVRKRYLINGKVPEGQDGNNSNQTQEVKAKVPPPPPINNGVKKAPPPPPIQGKKPARIAVNRYV